MLGIKYVELRIIYSPTAVDLFVVDLNSLQHGKNLRDETPPLTDPIRKFQQDFFKQILNVEGIESSFQGAFECCM